MSTESIPTGTYSDGSKVEILGHRHGFTYITFLTGPLRGTSVKVPPSWVTEDKS